MALLAASILLSLLLSPCTTANIHHPLPLLSSSSSSSSSFPDRPRRIDRVYLAAVQEVVDAAAAAAAERCATLPPCRCEAHAYHYITASCESCRCKSAAWFVPPPPPSTTSTTQTVTTTSNTATSITQTATATTVTTTTTQHPTTEYEPFSGCCRTAEGEKMEGLGMYNLNPAKADATSVASLEACFALCSGDPACTAVQYHRGDQTCSLVAGAVAATNSYPHCMCLVRYTEYPGVNDHHALPSSLNEEAGRDPEGGAEEEKTCSPHTICSCDVDAGSVEREWRTDANGCRTCGCFEPPPITTTAASTTTTTTTAAAAVTTTTTPGPALFSDPRLGGDDTVGGKSADETPADRTQQDNSSGDADQPSASALTAALTGESSSSSSSSNNNNNLNRADVEEGVAPPARLGNKVAVASFRKHSNTSCFPSYAYANTQVYTEFDLRGAEQFTGFSAKSAEMCLEVCSALASCGAAQYRHSPEMCFILLSLRNVTIFGQDTVDEHTCFRRNPAAIFGGTADGTSGAAGGGGGDEDGDDGNVEIAIGAPQTTVFVGGLPSSSTTQPSVGGSSDDVNAEIEKWLETLQAFNNNNNLYDNHNGGAAAADASFFSTLMNVSALNIAASAGGGQFQLSNTALGLMLGCILGVVLFTVVVRYYRPSKYDSADLDQGDGKRIPSEQVNMRRYNNGDGGRVPYNIMRTNMDNVLHGGGISYRGDEFDMLGGGLKPTHRLNPLRAGRRSTNGSTDSYNDDDAAAALRGAGGPRVNGIREKQSGDGGGDYAFAASGGGDPTTRHVVRENSMHGRAARGHGGPGGGNRRHNASMLLKKQSSGAATSTSDGFYQLGKTMKGTQMQRNQSASSMHKGFLGRSSSQRLLECQAEAILGGAVSIDFAPANESGEEAESILSGQGLGNFQRVQSDGAQSQLSVTVSEMERFERAQSDGASSVTSSDAELERFGRAQSDGASSVTASELDMLMSKSGTFSAQQHVNSLQQHVGANSEASL